MRTAEEIWALIDASKFRTVLHPRKKPAQLVTTKGEPPIFVCAEPAMTVSIGKKKYPRDIIGPITRLAMAWHLGLTEEEATAFKLTVADAQAELSVIAGPRAPL